MTGLTKRDFNVSQMHVDDLNAAVERLVEEARSKGDVRTQDVVVSFTFSGTMRIVSVNLVDGKDPFVVFAGRD